jgi:hypothetical protein
MGRPALSSRVLGIALVSIGCAGCGPRTAGPIVQELREMARADQLSRTPPNEPEPSSDARRQSRVLELLAQGAIQDPESQEHAALILQHSGVTIVEGKLAALSPDDYLLAHLLAKSAAERGRRSARALAAAALDRYLVFSDKPQKYGTQTLLDLKTNMMYVPPIDPSTTDAERAQWNVEPLAAFMKRFREENPAAR